MRTHDDLRGTRRHAEHHASERADRHVDDHTCPVQHVSLAVGIAFLVAGIAGFIPGVTTEYDTIEFAGHDSMAKLFGLFQVSILHNLLHLLVGVIGVIAARRARWARWYLVVGGLLFLALFVHGRVVDRSGDANVLPVNDADDWLHLGLGIAMVLLGAVLWRHRHQVDRRAHTTAPASRLRES